MATPNIVYLPGIFGSTIGFTAGPFDLSGDYWISPFAAFSGNLLQLELASDGVSPGPHTFGKALHATGLYVPTYAALGAWMRRKGWTVLDAPYDWRKSIRVTAPEVLALIDAAFGAEPFAFVAHSMGGLQARAVYGLMVQLGRGEQCKGMVQLGTPNFGSWEVVRGFHFLPELYFSLKWAAGLFGPTFGFYRVDFLDVILASWPGWYELLPWRDAGPLYLRDPATAAALYQLQTYAEGNPYVSQTWLDAAVQTQHYLAPAIPFGRLVNIVGEGFVTADERTPGASLLTAAGYQYTGDGDGQVPRPYSVLPTAPVVVRHVDHQHLPLDPSVWPAVEWGVRLFYGPGA